MKKFGFTLAEMVVSMAVVGVIAAISAPLVNDVIPDRKKVQVLKAYKQLTKINQDILSNPGLYMGSNGAEPSLNDTRSPVNQDIIDDATLRESAVGENKYIAILAHMLNVDGGDVNFANKTFNTSDGLFWNVNYVSDSSSTVSIDLKDGKGCIHSPDCPKPDKFEFFVANNGRVIGKDSLTRTYLANPHNLSDRKNDYKNSLKDAVKNEQDGKKEIADANKESTSE